MADHDKLLSPTAARSRGAIIRTCRATGHRDRRGVLRCRRRRAVRARGRRGGAAARRRARRDLPARRPRSSRPRPRTGADAVHPGYGFLVGERRLRPRCADAGLTFVGPSPDGDRGDGLEGRGEGADGGRRRAGAARRDRRAGRRARRRGRPDRLPAAGQGGAGGGGRGMRIVRDARRAGRGGRGGAARGRVGVRRRHGLPRALRGVDPRHVEVQIFGDTHGNVVAPVRARVLDPAPPPEDHRGGAVARRRRRAARPSCARRPSRRPRRRLRRRGHRRVPARRRRGVLLPRGQHPPAGRAPGDRAGHRARPRRAAAARSPRASRCRPR